MNMNHASVDFKVGDEGRISIMCDGEACEYLDKIRAMIEEEYEDVEVVGESTSSRKEDETLAIAVEEKPKAKGVKNMACGSIKKK